MILHGGTSFNIKSLALFFLLFLFCVSFSLAGNDISNIPYTIDLRYGITAMLNVIFRLVAYSLIIVIARGKRSL